MPRKPKESVNISCKIEKSVSDKIVKIANETGLSKTVIIEKAVKEYYDKYTSTGQI